MKGFLNNPCLYFWNCQHSLACVYLLWYYWSVVKKNSWQSKSSWLCYKFLLIKLQQEHWVCRQGIPRGKNYPRALIVNTVKYVMFQLPDQITLLKIIYYPAYTCPREGVIHSNVPRLRVVSNFGDGDCGASEIHTRACAKFREDATRGERQKLDFWRSPRVASPQNFARAHVFRPPPTSDRQN